MNNGAAPGNGGASVLFMEMESNPTLSDELAAVLDGLRAEGELNSSGVFTVDLAKALPKLEKFQLPKPHFGLLKVIQSGVVSGATRINTSFKSSSIRIEHNGLPPTPQELKQLLSFLMSPDHPTHERSLRDLAIGVNTTLARGASWVELSVRHGEKWTRQRWLSRQETEEAQLPKLGSRDMNVSFVMRRTLGQAASHALAFAKKDVVDILRKRREAMDEDSRAVYDRCRHAPVEIKVDGAPLPASLFGKQVSRKWSPFTWRLHRSSNLMDIYLVGKQPSPHLLSPPRGSDARLKLVIPGRVENGMWEQTGKPAQSAKIPEVERRCYAVLGIRGVASVPGSVTLVKDGVDLTTLAPPILPRGVTSILTAEGLPLDLSHFRIIAGDAVEERLKSMSGLLQNVLGELLEIIHLDDFEESEREHIRNLAAVDSGGAPKESLNKES